MDIFLEAFADEPDGDALWSTFFNQEPPTESP
jgi:hypothetical protein